MEHIYENIISRRTFRSCHHTVSNSIVCCKIVFFFFSFMNNIRETEHTTSGGDKGAHRRKTMCAIKMSSFQYLHANIIGSKISIKNTYRYPLRTQYFSHVHRFYAFINKKKIVLYQHHRIVGIVVISCSTCIFRCRSVRFTSNFVSVSTFQCVGLDATGPKDNNGFGVNTLNRCLPFASINRIKII